VSAARGFCYMKKLGKFLYNLYFGAVIFFASLFAFQARAQGGDVDVGLGKIKEPFGNGGRFSKTDDIYTLAAELIKVMLQLGFIVAVIFVIIGGYMYITAAGNEEQAGKGRKTIVYALIGVAVTIMSYVVVNVVINAIYNPSASGI
jgi:hypothetical protein